MVERRKISCPKCGGQLLYCVKTESHISRKINKDGRLSKVTHMGHHYKTDIYYLKCDSYKCTFSYNLSYPSMNKKEYRELDDWYEEYGDDFPDYPN